MGDEEPFVTEDRTFVEVKAPHATYLMPPDIAELIARGERGEIDMDYVIEETMNAVEDGRIGIIEDIG